MPPTGTVPTAHPVPLHSALAGPLWPHFLLTRAHVATWLSFPRQRVDLEWQGTGREGQEEAVGEHGGDVGLLPAGGGRH